MSSGLPLRLNSGSLAVETRDLQKSFGSEAALRGVDLQVPQEAVYVLAGPNGAGKTTTVKVLLDLVRADAGVAKVFGMNPRDHGPLVRAQIGYVPDRQDWGHGWMTVGRLMAHHAVFYRTWDWEYAHVLARAFDLRLDRRFGKLSKGQARRVQLALALAHRPGLLFLDEPTDGLDPAVRDDTLGVLADHLAENPTTLLISTHRIYEVDRLADHVGVMTAGRLIAQVSRDDLHMNLRRYRAAVPDEWSEPGELGGRVIRRSVIGREIQWLLWGDADEVATLLTVSGAIVQDVAPVTLEDATIALLSRREGAA